MHVFTPSSSLRKRERGVKMDVLSRDDVFSTRALVTSLGLLGLFWFVITHFYNGSYGKEKLIQIRQRRKLIKQGIKGPQPSFLHGNAPQLQSIVAQSKNQNHPLDLHGPFAHDFVPFVFPYFHQWAKLYGRVYTYTVRNKQHLYVGTPELIRELNQNISVDELGKPISVTKHLFPLFGNGVLRANGQLWSRQRKIIAPEFYNDKIKNMMGLMREASELLTRKWEAMIVGGGGKDVEVRVDEDLRSFSADVIARACFGSSFEKGEEIFSKLRALQKLLSTQGFLFKSQASEKEMEIKRLYKEVDGLIWDTVQERNHKGKDLMQLLLDNSVGVIADADKRKEMIIDNCKNIYFAGHETTAISSAWCLLLFSLYPDWQQRVREEVIEVFNPSPTLDSLNKMKCLNMFIQEVLRLYSPGAFVTREARKEMRLGELVIPKGVQIWALIPAFHRDPELWGADAHEFKPERFAGGVSNACKVPHAFIPFGVGPRNCLGKNFAMLELKLIICEMLSKFSFSLSPNYRHSPCFSMVVEPAHGVYLLMNKIE